MAANPVNTTLGGTFSLSVKQGVATFSNLSLNKAGQEFRDQGLHDPTDRCADQFVQRDSRL